jgi:hypothetical protein
MTDYELEVHRARLDEARQRRRTRNDFTDPTSDHYWEHQ